MSPSITYLAEGNIDFSFFFLRYIERLILELRHHSKVLAFYLSV